MHTSGGLRIDSGSTVKLSVVVQAFVGKRWTVPQFCFINVKKMFKCWREQFSKAVQKAFAKSGIQYWI
jgi:hypothetical protein